MLPPPELEGEVLIEWQRDRLDAPHVLAINEWIASDLMNQGHGWLPSISPVHGGFDARVLKISSDPGPGALRSGMLSMYNADPSAEAERVLLTDAGVSLLDIQPWNAYPWYIENQSGIKGSHRDPGAEVLAELINQMPELRVVVLHGGNAVDAWWRVELLRPELVWKRHLTVLRTTHTSNRGTRGSSPVRLSRQAQQRSTWAHVAELLSPTADLSSSTDQTADNEGTTGRSSSN